MRLDEGSYINNGARLEKEEDIEKESEAIDAEIEKDSVPEKKEERASLDSEEQSF